MTCPCCDNADPCPTCGSCSKRWEEGVDEHGEAFAGWVEVADEETGRVCGGPVVPVSQDSGFVEHLVSANGPICSCLIAARAGDYDGEIIAGICVSTAGECGCCFSIWDGTAWSTDENDNSCDSNHGSILAHGGGFVVRLTCTCPTPGGAGTTINERVQLDCVQSYFCDWDDGVTPNSDCADP